MKRSGMTRSPRRARSRTEKALPGRAKICGSQPSARSNRCIAIAAKARMNDDTIDYLIFAAMRLDLLGMKIQFAGEISSITGKLI